MSSSVQAAAERETGRETGRDTHPSTPHVEEMLKLLVKAIRAHQLYLHNNPTYLRALEATRAAFTPVWQEIEELHFEVTETELRFEGHAVLSEPEKASDSLPWILYKDGVRILRLLPEFETHELEPFLDIIQRVRRATHDEDDLLTLFWEQEFVLLRYEYVDLGQDVAAPLEASEPIPAVAEVQVHPAPEIDTNAPSIVRVDDFDSTLYFMDEREIDYLRDEVRKEYATDLRRNTVSMLLDTFEQQSTPAIRAEICSLLDTLMLHSLSAGAFGAVAFMIREMKVCAGRAPHHAALLALPTRLSEPEVLAQLLQSLDEASDLPSQEELNELFEQLRGGALATVLSYLGRLHTPRLKQMLERTAERLAVSNTAELVRLIASSDRDVALEAIRRSGSVRAAAAVAPMARLLSEADVPVRLAVVTALGEIGSPGALQLLERAVDDAHRDVRVATARALAARAHRAALPRLEGLITGKIARSADLTERMAIFEAFGTVCGDGGVPLLDSLLNGKSLFGRREDPEVRACAAMALGRVGTAAAMSSLQRASSEKEVLVRNAVNRALRAGPT